MSDSHNAKEWTVLDVEYTREYRPLEWQRQGLQQTASGYGRKLTSRYCVRLADRRLRRVYVSQFSNAGTAWITLDGARRIIESWTANCLTEVLNT